MFHLKSTLINLKAILQFRMEKYFDLNRQLEDIILKSKIIEETTDQEKIKISQDILRFLDKLLFLKDHEFDHWYSLNKGLIFITDFDFVNTIHLFKSFKEWYWKNDKLYKDHLSNLQFYYQHNGLPKPDHWFEIFLVEFLEMKPDKIFVAKFTLNRERLILKSHAIKEKLDWIVKNKKKYEQNLEKERLLPSQILVLKKFLDDSKLYNSLGEGQKEEVLGYIMGLKPDSAKRYKNKNKGKFKEEDSIMYKEFLKKINVGD